MAEITALSNGSNTKASGRTVIGPNQTISRLIWGLMRYPFIPLTSAKNICFRAGEKCQSSVEALTPRLPAPEMSQSSLNIDYIDCFINVNLIRPLRNFATEL